ncbi:MAG: hypothetical protein ACRCTZ_05045 [Sarcina sp.]
MNLVNIISEVQTVSLFLSIIITIITIFICIKKGRSFYLKNLLSDYLFILISILVIYSLYESGGRLEHQILGGMEILITGFFAFGEITTNQWNFMNASTSFICLVLLGLIIFVNWRIFKKVKGYSEN